MGFEYAVDSAFSKIKEEVNKVGAVYSERGDMPHSPQVYEEMNFLKRSSVSLFPPPSLPPIRSFWPQAEPRVYTIERRNIRLTYSCGSGDPWFGRSIEFDVLLTSSKYDAHSQWTGVTTLEVSKGGECAITFRDGTMTNWEALAYARSLDGLLLQEGHHRDVIDNSIWREMYCVETANTVPFPRKDAAGNNGTGEIHNLKEPHRDFIVPCHNCGFYWPFQYIEIDHYIPKKSHLNDRLALLKALRLLDMTVEDSTGRKAINLQGIAAGALQHPTPIHPNNHDPGRFQFTSVYRQPDKETPTPKGMVFALLLLIGSAGGLTAIDDLSKNLLSNLVPLCGPCNNNKNNRIKLLAPRQTDQ